MKYNNIIYDQLLAVDIGTITLNNNHAITTHILVAINRKYALLLLKNKTHEINYAKHNV